MKIIEVVQHLAPGGIETLVLELQKVYQSLDKVIIISLENNQQQALTDWQRLEDVQCELIFLNKQPGLKYGIVKQLIALFKQHKPDAVHTHHIGPLLYAGLAAKHLKLQSVIHTEHDVWHLQSSRKRHLLQYALLNYIKPKLVADAEYVGKALSKLFPKHRNHVISNGIDIDAFYPSSLVTARKKMGLPTDVKIIGCAARLVPGKGHLALLTSLTKLPSSVHLALAGDGPLKAALMKQCKKLKVEQQVHFLGSLDNMAAFYRCLDVFCLASEAEGLPLSPLEAQACNVPVVVTDVGGCREAVCPHTGLLVRPKDQEALTNGLKTVLSRKLLMLNHRPRDFVKKEHSLRNMAHLYRQLMIKRGNEKWL
ncbi:glycosyltransferase [Marinomonas transparens]|uniref:Glycosyltransferase n=1 Tax=Marinomonas transparens TaxID=2795388 RepID=A0A934N064_9GAMM|nr:glycosyltransferase [Marinomonas transparens]MBJ7538255.1 glycosyltransferase [Marinomonas transparens]